MLPSLTSEFCSDSNMYLFNRPSIASSRRCTSDIKPCHSNRLPSNCIIKNKSYNTKFTKSAINSFKYLLILVSEDFYEVPVCLFEDNVMSMVLCS